MKTKLSHSCKAPEDDDDDDDVEKFWGLLLSCTPALPHTVPGCTNPDHDRDDEDLTFVALVITVLTFGRFPEQLKENSFGCQGLHSLPGLEIGNGGIV